MELKRFQIFPKKNQLDWCCNQVQSDFKIDKNTKIISAGSCFAREIKNWLMDNKFNYLTEETEKNVWVSHDIFKGDQGRLPYEHGSIAWERIYNIQTLKQLLMCKDQEEVHKNRFHSFVYNNKNYVADLLRNRIVYPNMETAIQDIKDHTRITDEIIKEADLFIFTLGMTEVWENDYFVLGSNSPEYKLDNSYKFNNLNFGSSFHSLCDVCHILFRMNPKIKILLSVSPVHLNVTGRNIDVVSASCESKSILRAVAGEVCNVFNNVYYFPSYELATIIAPMIGIKTHDADNHHISKEVIDLIMEVFVNVYVTRD